MLVHGRDPQRGEQTVKEIEAAGGVARFLAADLREPADVSRLAELAGEVDILVNNAGSSWFGPTAEPAEIGEVIAFLAGPKAGYITGATIPVDGGRTAV